MKFQEMTAERIKGLDRSATLVIAPVAAVEQHGPHLPTGTDTIICTAIAEALEHQFAGQVLLLPTCWHGASSHHLRFGATVDVRLPHYIELLKDIASSLLEDGFRRLLFINGHGGNVDPLRVALRDVQPSCPEALLAGDSYWAVADELLAEVLDGDHKFVGHACEFETSLIMHLRPELVSMPDLADAGELVPNDIDRLFVARDMMQRTRRGCTGRPDLATAAKGERLFAGIVQRLSDTVRRLLQEPLGTDYRQFVGE